MITSLMPVPKQQYFGIAGIPLIGGKVFTYAAGTSTPKPTYTDSDGTIAQANPIILNSRGEPANAIFWSGAYKVVVQDALGNTIYTVDNYNTDPAGLWGLAASLLKGAGAALIGFLQAGVGAVVRTVQDKLRDTVHVKDFGAVCDGVTDDSAAVQKAINYCLSFQRAKPLRVGRCFMAASVNVDRPVDNTYSEFRIIADGDGGGFYTNGNVIVFDSTLAVTTDPRSEFVSFENIQFETNLVANESYAISKKFLRCKFINCNFRLMRCVLSDIYVQTLYFLHCNIRNTRASFLNCVGLYDVVFDGCVIENGSTLVRCVDAARGCNGLRVTNNVIEGIQSSVIVADGLSGFVYENNHSESNFSPEINCFAGALKNHSLTIKGNYIYNPGGPFIYYGPTVAVASIGNTVFPSQMHSNAVQVDNLVSMGDDCTGGISDSTIYSTMAGITSSGGVSRAWSDSQNHLTKSADGHFGFGAIPNLDVRLWAFGENSLPSKYAAAFANSNGLPIATFRNDRVIEMPGLLNFASDAAAAAGGIPVGGLYRIGNALQTRLV